MAPIPIKKLTTGFYDTVAIELLNQITLVCMRGSEGKV